MLKQQWEKQIRRFNFLVTIMALWFSITTIGWAMPVATEQTERPVLTVEQSIVVQAFKITGQNLVPESELLAPLADKLNKPATLGDLESYASLVTRQMKARGYMVAMAYIPPQSFQGGEVNIAVLAGNYGKITVKNTTSISEQAIRRELGEVKEGASVNRATLERAVWFVGDLTGAEAKAIFSVGEKPGTTDLTLNVNPKGKPTWGYMSVDNGGNRYTGRIEYVGNVNQANLAKEGDLLTAQFLQTGGGFANGNVNYLLPALGQGQKIGFGWAQSHYLLGDQYAALDAEGIAKTFNLKWQMALERTRRHNLYLEARFENKDLVDEVRVANERYVKNSRNVVFNLYGDSLDDTWGGGANSYALTYTTGRLTLKDEVSRVNDSSGAQTAGQFGKWNLSLTRLQKLEERLALYGYVFVQGATKNLDSSEHLVLGGPNGVRAYPQGEAGGDQGWLGTLELRYNLPVKEHSASGKSAQDTYQLSLFVDGGSVWENHSPFTIGENRRNLAGMGLGFQWNRADNFALRLSYAWKLGSEQAISDNDANGRFWWQFYKFF